MWKNKLYRNVQLEFRLFIVLIHLSRLETMLQSYYTKLQSARRPGGLCVATDATIVAVPEELGMVWKGVMNIREHLRAKKQEFQITKGQGARGM